MSDDSATARPVVAVGRLPGENWTLSEESTRDRRFGTTRAVERTVVYVDENLGRRVAATTGDDRPWRFFFASTLAFDPPLPPITGTASTFPTVAREARSAFEDDLRERGLSDLTRRRRERIRVASGNRASLYPYRGRLRDADVDVAAFLTVWTVGREFRLAGGGYPEQLPGGLDAAPSDYRDELFDLVRAVE